MGEHLIQSPLLMAYFPEALLHKEFTMSVQVATEEEHKSSNQTNNESNINPSLLQIQIRLKILMLRK